MAYILLGKLYRRPVPRIYEHRYRLYLNRRDVRQKLQLMRQIRGRKFVSGPEGASHNLEELFERLNRQYFDGLLGRPQLGWSRQASRSLLGHFDPSHNAIIISRIFDRPQGEEYYGWVERCVRLLADEAGLPAYTLQAILWIAVVADAGEDVTRYHARLA